MWYEKGEFIYQINAGEGGKDLYDVVQKAIDEANEEADYLKAFKTNADGVPELSNANSPLASYENYMMDYENPLGAGRIVIK